VSHIRQSQELSGEEELEIGATRQLPRLCKQTADSDAVLLHISDGILVGTYSSKRYQPEGEE
jgi:hypothetical protein